MELYRIANFANVENVHKFCAFFLYNNDCDEFLKFYLRWSIRTANIDTVHLINIRAVVRERHEAAARTYESNEK